MTELKRCPFCGGEVYLSYYSSWDNMYHVHHTGDVRECAFNPIDIDGRFAKSFAEAAEVWNRRANNEHTN